MRTSATLLASALAFAAFAQESTYQLALDPPGNNSFLEYADAALYADGSVAYMARTQQWSGLPSTAVITKLSAAGAILWSRSIAPVPTTNTFTPKRVVAMADGGAAVFGSTSDSMMLYSQFTLVRLNASGDLLFSRNYQPSTGAFDWDYGYSSAKAMPDGGLVMNLGLTSTPTFVRLNAAGDMIWARSFITDDPDTSKVPTFDFGVTDNGGLLITEKANSDMMMILVDATGNEVWSHRYNSGMYTHTKNAMQLANGDYLVCGFNSEPFAARLGPGGNVLWMRSYTLPAIYDGFQRLVEMPNGELLFSARADNYWGTPSAEVLLRTDANGTPMDRITINSQVSNAQMELVGMHGGQLLLAGKGTVGIDGGFESFHQLWRIEPVFPGPCGTDAYLGSTVPYTDQESSVSMSDGCNVTDRTVTVSTFTVNVTDAVYTSHDLCFLLTSVDEEQGRAAVNVYPSPIAAGNALTVEATGAAAVQLIAADGRVVQQAATNNNDRTILGTTGLTAGLYLVRVLAATGAPLHETRVVVQ